MIHVERSAIRDAYYFSYQRLFEIGYAPQVFGLENLKRVREHPDKPLVVYSNHIAAEDPFLVQWLMLNELRQRMNDVIVPVSDDYANVSRSQMKEYAYMVKLYKGIGIQMPHVIQTYRLRQKGSAGNAQKTEQLEQLRSTSSALVGEFDRLLDTGLRRGAAFYLAPEGHRSDNGTLRPAESGLGYIVGKMRRLAHPTEDAQREAVSGLVLPVALTHPADFKRYINFHVAPRHPLAFTIGKPLSAEEVYTGTRELYGKESVRFEHVSHYLMLQLASALPDTMKGYYHPDVLADTLSGRYYYATDEGGSVRVFDDKENSFV